MYGINPNTGGQKGKEEGALAGYTQQIHLRVKGTICASFSITSQVRKIFKTPDGMLLSTFNETAIVHGLLESDTEWDNCLSEASISFMPNQNNYGHYLLLFSYLVNL